MPLDITLDLERVGTKIIVPEKVTLADAIDYLQRRQEEEEQVMEVHEVVPAHPADGALALAKAYERLFGLANTRGLPGMFGERPPQMISVEVEYGQTIQVQWSGYKVPQIDGTLKCAAVPAGNTLHFAITGKVRKKHLHLVKKLADLTRQIAAAESIYKGKAVILPVDEEGRVDNMNFKFFDIRGASKDNLIFSDSLMEQIQANVFTPLEHTEACRTNKVPLKRGILLAGKYGTGKTLAARVTAATAIANGWTFILVQRVAGLRAAIEVARMYAPCVVFAEDLDRAVAGDERTVSIDDILNIVDGVESKSDELMLVLTTNHVDRINKAMLRPGRIDALIEVTPPDADAARKLVRMYGGNLISADDPLAESGELLDGQIPAVIAEVVRKAKLYALSRDPNALQLTDSDIAGATRGMEAHLKMMADAIEDNSTPEHKLGSALGAIVTDRVAGQLQEHERRVH